jgi:hypothetical protein
MFLFDVFLSVKEYLDTRKKIFFRVLGDELGVEMIQVVLVYQLVLVSLGMIQVVLVN